jgi:hypothetical protein
VFAYGLEGGEKRLGEQLLLAGIGFGCDFAEGKRQAIEVTGELRADFKEVGVGDGFSRCDILEMLGALPLQAGSTLAHAIELGGSSRKRSGGDIVREEFRELGSRILLCGNLLAGGLGGFGKGFLFVLLAVGRECDA